MVTTMYNNINNKVSTKTWNPESWKRNTKYRIKYQWEDTQEKLDDNTFSYINNASVNLNKVCLHVTYLFLEELVIASDVFLLASVQRK